MIFMIIITIIIVIVIINFLDPCVRDKLYEEWGTSKNSLDSSDVASTGGL